VMCAEVGKILIFLKIFACNQSKLCNQIEPPKFALATATRFFSAICSDS
jgi:hypothetical protein